MGAFEMGWQMAETKMNPEPCGEGGSGLWQHPCSMSPASAQGLGGHCTLPETTSPDPPGSLAASVAHSWLTS